MPEKICKGCGGRTNTTVCNYIDQPDYEPTECYMRWGDNGWEKGCAYEKADSFTKMFVDKCVKFDKGPMIARMERGV